MAKSYEWPNGAKIIAPETSRVDAEDLKRIGEALSRDCTIILEKKNSDGEWEEEER